MKRILAVVLVATMTIGLTACGAKEEESAGYVDDGVLTVGIDEDFPPMSFIGEDGEITGFDMEVCTEGAKRMGMEIKIQPISWDAKDMELESGTIDCIWDAFTMNGREDLYTWTTPYMDNAQVIVVAADSGITSLADLAGKTVEVQADSSAETAFKEDKADLADTFGSLLTVPEYNTAFMDLEQGAVDAIALDIIVADYQLQQRGDGKFIVLDEPIATEQYAVGMKLGNTELCEQIQAVLDEMAADGTLAEISTKWFGEDITTIGK